MKRLFSSTNSSPGIFPTAYWENSGNKSTFIDKNRAIFKLFDGILGPTSNQNSLADILIINESRKCSEFQFDEGFTVSKDQTLNLDSFLFFS